VENVQKCNGTATVAVAGKDNNQLSNSSHDDGVSRVARMTAAVAAMAVATAAATVVTAVMMVVATGTSSAATLMRLISSRMVNVSPLFPFLAMAREGRAN
jgi:hypothetical protein